MTKARGLAKTACIGACIHKIWSRDPPKNGCMQDTWNQSRQWIVRCSTQKPRWCQSATLPHASKECGGWLLRISTPVTTTSCWELVHPTPLLRCWGLVHPLPPLHSRHYSVAKTHRHVKVRFVNFLVKVLERAGPDLVFHNVGQGVVRPIL